MTLNDILIETDALQEYDVVYAKRPWGSASAARIKHYDAGDSVKRVIDGDSSFEYFLEGALIKDIRSQLEEIGKSSEEAVDAILFYAENDAFP